MLNTSHFPRHRSQRYNPDPAAGEVSVGGTPYGFFHYPLDGFAPGYPVLLDNVMSQGRAAQVWPWRHKAGPR